jgi:D-alanyl-lipoteichoic acid acyltransferase DltB (MBOAT superfamily)
MITMILGGLWHGAAWTFVFWGVYQGLLLVAYRAGDRLKGFTHWVEGRTRMARLTSWLVMFHLTCYGWLIFRARSVEQIGSMTRAMFTDLSPAAVSVETLLVPLLLYVTPLLLVHAIEAHADDLLIVPKLPVTVRYSVYAATFYLTILFGNFGGAEFIYFQF